MFVEMIYAIVTFPDLYPILAVLLFVVLGALVAMLTLIPVDKGNANERTTESKEDS